MPVFWLFAPCVALQKLTDVSEMLSVSIIAIGLMMEAAISSETSVISTGLHGATSQKTGIFVLAVVRI
jgi:predicted permease